MLDRAIRETIAIVIVLSVIAGSTRCHRTSPKMATSPVRALSIV